MKTEVYTDPKEFMRALKKGARQPVGKGRRPRVDAGEGDRQRDLETLAAAGWTCTHSDGVSHWMSNRAGEYGPRVSSYRAMLDERLNFVKGHS